MRIQLLMPALLSTASLAQVTIEGDVALHPTGEPLPGVRVVASCPEYHWAATDVGGHFRFFGLPASSQYCALLLDGPRLRPQNKTVWIHPQDTDLSVRVEMKRPCAITGKVMDENGWPVGAGLALAQYFTFDGDRRLQRVASVSADDRGEFRLGKLLPGRYYLQVSAPRDYLPFWYPAGGVEDAQPIDLKQGQEITGFDIHLARGGGVTLRGRVIPPAGFQPGQMFLRVSPENLNTIGGAGRVPIAKDGSFIMSHVAPGVYMFAASRTEFVNMSVPALPPYLATRTVVVSHDNVEGITLQVVEPTVRDLRRTVVFEGGGRPDQVSVSVARLQERFSARAKVEPDGSFVIPGLWPGRYMVRAGAAGVQVTSIRLGDQELADREFDFDGSPADLRVTAARTVRILGTVRDASGHPVSGAGVIFVRSEGVYEPPPSLVFGYTNANGGFYSSPLLPGVYRIYVVEDPSDAAEDMADPVFLKSQEKAFPPVSVALGENAPLKLALPSN